MASPEAELNLKENQCTATIMPRRSERIKRKFEASTSKSVTTAKRVKTTAGKLECSSTLTNINEDCLRHIFQYLNIVDMVNLAATCQWLQYFARKVIYPKKAKELCVDTSYRTSSDGALTASLSAPLNTNPPKLKMKSIETGFSHFGEFVEKLTFNLSPAASCGIRKEKSKTWRSCKIMMEHCQNLKTLRFKQYQFLKTETLALQMSIEKMPHLKELDFRSCSGLTNNWPRMSLESSSKVHTLSVSTRNKVSGHLFVNYRNLSSLTIDVCGNVWQTDDIAKIFDDIGDSLKHLSLLHLYRLNGHESVGSLITDKLRKLESLELELFELSDRIRYMTEFPYLKSLSINCFYESINSLLQTQSRNGFIETLLINYGIFDIEDTNAAPLIFDKLQRFGLCDVENMPNLLQTMTRSKTPVIHFLSVQYIRSALSHEILNELIKFIDSKNTLKTIRLFFYGNNSSVLIDFLRQLIDLLKKPCTPKRLFLNLEVWPRLLGANEMQLLNENRHLIKVVKFKA